MCPWFIGNPFRETFLSVITYICSVVLLTHILLLFRPGQVVLSGEHGGGVHALGVHEGDDLFEGVYEAAAFFVGEDQQAVQELFLKGDARFFQAALPFTGHGEQEAAAVGLVANPCDVLGGFQAFENARDGGRGELDQLGNFHAGQSGFLAMIFDSFQAQ